MDKNYIIEILLEKKDLRSRMPLMMDIDTDEKPSIAYLISVILNFKNKFNIIPYGFVVLNANDLSDYKNYYINGKIVKNNVNKHIGITEYIYIKSRNIYIPYEKETDTILNVNI